MKASKTGVQIEWIAARLCKPWPSAQIAPSPTARNSAMGFGPMWTGGLLLAARTEGWFMQ
jgi:hypothetical protein